MQKVTIQVAIQVIPNRYLLKNKLIDLKKRKDNFLKILIPIHLLSTYQLLLPTTDMYMLNF